MSVVFFCFHFYYYHYHYLSATEGKEHHSLNYIKAFCSPFISLPCSKLGRINDQPVNREEKKTITGFPNPKTYI